MEIIQIAAYSLLGGLLGYGLPQLGWDLAQRQNGKTTTTDQPQVPPTDSDASDEKVARDLKRPAD